MQVKSEKIIVYLAIFVFVSAIGATAGYNLSNPSGEKEIKGDQFCQNVEKGLAKEMDQGFVNCFKPRADYFQLRQDIENSTSLKCVCRKKVGELIQELKIAQSSP